MPDFLPQILPEDKIPIRNRGCQQCELSTHKNRMIWGEGNPTAPIFVVLDNPGAREDKDGREFLCGTRETLQLATFEAGLNLDVLYISFLLKCRPRRAYDKSSARTTCVKYLWDQLASVDPTIVVCLGDVVCQAFFADPEVQVKKLRGTIHPIKDYKVVASYHPLAARRRPALYQYLVEDLKKAANQLP